MRVHLILIVCLIVVMGVAQTQDSKVMPSVTTVPIEEGAITLLHLAPGYDFGETARGDQLCGHWQSRELQGGALGC